MKKELIEKNDKIIISFSTGPDSVYLFHKLDEIKKEYNLEIKLLYVNHKIRIDVDKDLEFLDKFSKKNNVEYVIYEIDKENPSENYSRQFRYKVLEEELKKINFNKIATGHNLNDKIETFIFRLIRGTSLDGLKSIKEKRGNIIRPILDEKKEDILKYLEDKGYEYRIDYTNFENNYSRNKIRNLIFPIMKEINSNYLDKILQIIDEIDCKYMHFDNEEMKIIKLLKEKNIEYNKNLIKSIINLKDNGTSYIDLDKEYIFVNSYGKYYIEKKKKFSKTYEEKNLLFNDYIKFNDYIIVFTDFKNKKNIVKKAIMKYNVVKYLLTEYEFFDKLDFIDKNIKVRNFLNGDIIKIKNLGTKKVKKVFIDEKINSLYRNKIPIIIYDDQVILVGNIKNSVNLIKRNKENYSNNLIISVIKIEKGE